MIKYLKDILGFEEEEKEAIEPEIKDGYCEEKKLQIATCALFVELAKADSRFDENEREHIINVMREKFNLEKQYVNELLELAERKLKDTVSLYEFTTVINEKFSHEEKFELLLNLWRLIFVDKKLDKYEDHLIKLIGGMLNVEHRDIIAAKLIVKEENSSGKN